MTRALPALLLVTVVGCGNSLGETDVEFCKTVNKGDSLSEVIAAAEAAGLTVHHNPKCDGECNFQIDDGRSVWGTCRVAHDEDVVTSSGWSWY